MTASAPSVHLPDVGHRAGSPAYRRVLGALFAAGVATFALMYSTQALLPELSAAFGVSSAASTLSVSLTTLGLAVALLVAGPVSDVVGRTRLIHLSLGTSALLAGAGALAPSWSALLTLRLLEGVALAGLPAVATAYLREELHPTVHARAAGLYIGGTAVGGMVGRLLTGAVGELAGWRWALAVTALLGLLCAIVVRVALPASQQFASARGGLSGVLRASRGVVGDRALLALYGIGACGSGIMVVLLNSIGFRLTAAPFHLGLAATSLVFLVYPVGTVSSTLLGRLADARGRRTVLPIGIVLCAVGLVVTLPPSLPVIVVGLALVTGGFFAVHALASGWVPARAHAGGASTGQAASLYLFSYYLGSSVFGSLTGQAWSWHGWPAVVALAAVLLAVVCALATVLRRTASLLPSS